MALHSADRHAKSFGNLGGVQVFLISKQHHHPGVLRQRFHQPAHTFIQQEIFLLAFDLRFGHGLKVYFWTQLAFARFVDAAMTDGSPEPPSGMRRGLDLTQIPVELKKNILRQFLGPTPVTQKTHREAEDQRLVICDDPREIHFHTGYYGLLARQIASGEGNH